MARPPERRRPLTPLQQRLFDAFRDHLTEHDELPRAEQLTTAVDVQTPGTVLYHLGWLVEAGHLRHTDGQPGRFELAAADGRS